MQIDGTIQSHRENEVVRTAIRDPIDWIAIHRPERRIASNDDAASLIAAWLVEAESIPQIRAVVLRGSSEKALCAGGDLRAGHADSPFEDDPARPQNPKEGSSAFREERPARLSGN